jgi:hypothetical protein
MEPLGLMVAMVGMGHKVFFQEELVVQVVLELQDGVQMEV